MVYYSDTGRLRKPKGTQDKAETFNKEGKERTKRKRLGSDGDLGVIVETEQCRVISRDQI